MSALTTHILDTSRGLPAAGVLVVLDARAPDGENRELGRGVTDADGRLRELLPAGTPLQGGIYRLTFHTGPYFAANNTQGFYPEVAVTFVVRDPSQHYHVPLLLNPHGYSTYRGS